GIGLAALIFSVDYCRVLARRQLRAKEPPLPTDQQLNLETTLRIWAVLALLTAKILLHLGGAPASDTGTFPLLHLWTSSLSRNSSMRPGPSSQQDPQHSVQQDPQHSARLRSQLCHHGVDHPECL
ncbi:hypothetical protein PMAYCL1PPCAC_20269, partial [Pristionchus mayeri]